MGTAKTGPLVFWKLHPRPYKSLYTPVYPCRTADTPLKGHLDTRARIRRMSGLKDMEPNTGLTLGIETFKSAVRVKGLGLRVQG